jgi:hypothetical protein
VRVATVKRQDDGRKGAKKLLGDECGCGGGLLGPNASRVLDHDG